jgi:hypothetical protein
MAITKPNDDEKLIAQPELVSEVHARDQKPELVEVMAKETPSVGVALQGNDAIDPAIIQKVKDTADIIFAGVDTPE